MTIAPDFKDLLPKASDREEEDDDRPIYYLWTWDPEEDKIHMDHNEDRQYADYLTHETLAPSVHHPDKVHGYAYSIKGGWRITDDSHKEVDKHISHLVWKALEKLHPEPPLPNINR